MNREQNIINMIAEELGRWMVKHDEAIGEEKYIVHGAVQCLVNLSGKPGLITREYLLKQFNEHKGRRDRDEIADRHWELKAKNRAGKACEAIISLGKRIVELDKK